MIFAVTYKEVLLLRRDLHALAVLFLMPIAFLLVMSLALPSQQNQSASLLDIAVFSPNDSHYNQALLKFIHHEQQINWQQGELQDLAAWQNKLHQNGLSALIILPTVSDQESLETTETQIAYSAHLDYPSRQLINAAVLANLGKARLFMFLKSMRGANDPKALEALQQEAEKTTQKDIITAINLSQQTALQPSPVQQSVPAWLVFGMFFVLIPLSTTLIVELNQGTLTRLQTMGVSSSAYLGGKLIPYFVIHQIQFALMLFCGYFIVPLLGGEALKSNGSLIALFIMAIACSIAALGFSTLIATLVKTTEQATLIGGGSNIILAAIGGIMIPKYIMPENMQIFSQLSPMSWALDGFLDIILYGKSYADILFPLLLLTGFGLLCFSIAIQRFYALTAQR